MVEQLLHMVYLRPLHWPVGLIKSRCQNIFMGVWATVNGVRAMVLERVVEWDGEEHYHVLYSRDAEGNLARGGGIPGLAEPDKISWDCKCAESLVPVREVKQTDKLSAREVWELEQQWAE